MFSMTGWKIGFVCAAPALMQGLAKAHQFLTFTTPPNLQTAVAYGLREERAFLAEQRARLQQSRDRFVGGLRAIGFETLNAQATYFCSIALPASAGSDADFCLGMVRGVGVAAIPFSAFYAEHPVTNVVRFCFAKTDVTLDAALDRLRKL